MSKSKSNLVGFAVYSEGGEHLTTLYGEDWNQKDAEHFVGFLAIQQPERGWHAKKLFVGPAPKDDGAFMNSAS